MHVVMSTAVIRIRKIWLGPIILEVIALLLEQLYNIVHFFDPFIYVRDVACFLLLDQIDLAALRLQYDILLVLSLTS